MINTSNTAEALEAEVENRISAALTPEVLSKLAFRGVTPQQARIYLRQRVVLSVLARAAQ